MGAASQVLKRKSVPDLSLTRVAWKAHVAASAHLRAVSISEAQAEAREVAQWMKAFAAKSGNLNLMPGTNVVEGQN